MDWFTQVMQTLANFRQVLRLADLIDVALVAFLIYRFMLLVRKTTAANVAKAILLLIGALWISDLLQLHVINFILGRAAELGLLAIIIVFQPEIRKVLEQVGSSSLSKVFGRDRQDDAMRTAITATVAASTNLSKDKMGALIVFERKNYLDDSIKIGTALDCEPNEYLLRNLFWDKAPLHDGAVIIRSGRIAGAGCMLPLSGNLNLSRDLGMRHRAGLGVSERSDAVVVIVSEETGAISLAVGGLLKRHLAPENLEKLLRNELMPDAEDVQDAKPPFLAGLLKNKKGRKKDGQ